MIRSFPGTPDPSFFGTSRNETKSGSSGNDEEGEHEEDRPEPEGKERDLNEKKGRAAGIGFWLNAFTVCFIVYIVGIMLSQRNSVMVSVICVEYGFSISRLLTHVFPREMALIKRIGSLVFHI